MEEKTTGLTGWDAKNFRKILEKSGVSREDVGKAVGCSPQTIYTYTIRERSTPSLARAVQLADFFGVPLDYLCGRCSLEESESVLRDFSSCFSILSRGRYEGYLLRRRGGFLPAQYLRSAEAPYPYNLLDDIVSRHTGKREEADYWQDILTEDQEAGLLCALSTLTEKERRVVDLYYREDKTLEEVGKQESATRERIRQIIAKAVRKLRHPRLFNLIRYGMNGYEGVKAEMRRAELLRKREETLDEWESELLARKAVLDEIFEGMSSVSSKTDASAADIACMDLSVRSYNCLKRAGLNTLQDVCDCARSGQLLRVRNLGRKSLREVLSKVQSITGEDYREVYSV